MVCRQLLITRVQLGRARRSPSTTAVRTVASRQASRFATERREFAGGRSMTLLPPSALFSAYPTGGCHYTLARPRLAGASAFATWLRASQRVTSASTRVPPARSRSPLRGPEPGPLALTALGLSGDRAVRAPPRQERLHPFAASRELDNGICHFATAAAWRSQTCAPCRPTRRACESFAIPHRRAARPTAAEQQPSRSLSSLRAAASRPVRTAHDRAAGDHLSRRHRRDSPTRHDMSSVATLNPTGPVRSIAPAAQARVS